MYIENSVDICRGSGLLWVCLTAAQIGKSRIPVLSGKTKVGGSSDGNSVEIGLSAETKDCSEKKLLGG